MVGENAVEILCTLGEGMSTSTGCKLLCDWDAPSDDKKTTIQNYTTLTLWLSLSLSDIIKVIQFITSLVTSKLQAKICWEKKYVTLYKTLTRCEKDIFHV